MGFVVQDLINRYVSAECQIYGLEDHLSLGGIHCRTLAGKTGLGRSNQFVCPLGEVPFGLHQAMCVQNTADHFALHHIRANDGRRHWVGVLSPRRLCHCLPRMVECMF